jgi:DNA-binding CsgD family transcriptional regulator
MGYKTEREVLISQVQNLYLIDKLLRSEGSDLQDLVDEIPGIFHTNHRTNLMIDNLNKDGENYLHLSGEEINEMGMDFFNEYTHEKVREVVVPRFLEFYEKADDEKVKAEFQLIRNPKTDKFEPFFTVCKPFKEKELLLTSSNPVKNLGLTNAKIERIVGEEIFVRKHFSKFQTLTEREVQILTLLAKGNNNPAISEQLFISRYTVEQHRKNINKKLGLKGYRDLIHFAQAFDLV